MDPSCHDAAASASVPAAAAALPTYSTPVRDRERAPQLFDSQGRAKYTPPRHVKYTPPRDLVWSPIRRKTQQQRNSSEAEVVEGVDEQISPEGSSIHPPANSPSKKRPPKKKNGTKKRSNQKSQHKRANDKKADEKEAGSRVIINHSPLLVAEGDNSRKCILDSLLALIGDPLVKKAVASSFEAEMPMHGDTSISATNKALAPYGMVLERATSNYQNGCRAFNLMQVRNCRLVVSVQVWNREDPRWYTTHCVAWDGKMVHDRPKSVKVNNTTDRTKVRGGWDVFNRIFHTGHYAKWQITNIYELVDT